jgi:hypothetical protein
MDFFAKNSTVAAIYRKKIATQQMNSQVNRYYKATLAAESLYFFNCMVTQCHCMVTKLLVITCFLCFLGSLRHVIH